MDRGRAAAWLPERVRYEGTGRAHFTDPAGTITGPASVTVSPDGDIEIVLAPADPTSGWPDHAARFFAGVPAPAAGGPATWSLGDPCANECHALEIATGTGTWTATGQITYAYESVGAPRMTFRALRSSFEATAAAPAAFWVLPLLNFIPWEPPLAKIFYGYRRWHGPELEAHPLRLHAVPQLAPADQPLIVFAFRDAPGFIEPLADYANRLERLRARSLPRLVTAVMVGAIDGATIGDDALDTWFPFDFLFLLGLATGKEVGAPWIEFRDAAGNLARRVHRQLGAPVFVETRGAITEEYQRGGIGRLLTRAIGAPAFGQSYLRVAIRRLIRADLNAPLSLDDRLSQLYRAFEGLAKGLRFDRPRPLSETLASLGDAERLAVAEALRTAASAIRTVRQASQLTDEDDAGRALTIIADKVVGAGMLTTGFDRALLAMLAAHGLHDAAALAAHHGHPNTWPKTIAKYRQLVTHTGYIDFQGGSYDPDEVARTARHLHDILLRLLLRLVDYDGRYQPTVEEMSDAQPVDWVTPTTPVRRLGFR